MNIQNPQWTHLMIILQLSSSTASILFIFLGGCRGTPQAEQQTSLKPLMLQFMETLQILGVNCKSANACNCHALRLRRT